MAGGVTRGEGAREVELLQWARGYAPTLRDRRTEIEALARIPDDIVRDLQDAGAYAMMNPRAYGGLQTNFSTYMKVISELGRGDGGVAWSVSLVNLCNWIVSWLFPKSVVDEVFADPNVRIAGMLDPRAVKARPVEGGVHIDKGMWFFNSGCPQAHWDLLAVPLFDEAGEVAGRGLALMPISDVNILGDWDTTGMRGSGSNNVTAENVFVPSQRILDLGACVKGGAKPFLKEEALGYSTFSPVTVVPLIFPMLGLGKHMLEKFLELIPTRGIRVTHYARQSDSPVMHHLIGEASAKIDAAEAIIARACGEIDEWAERREFMPLMNRARIIRDCALADRLVWEGVDMLAGATSGSFARRTYPMNGIWQDARVATMHPFVSYHSNLEMYGRLACGIEPPMMPV